MMNEITGLGVKLQLEDAAMSGTYTDVANVVSVTLPGLVAADVEIDSLDDDYVRSIPGPIQAAEIQATINWDEDGTQIGQLVTIAEAREIRGWRIVFPSNYGVTTKGYVKFEPQELTRDDAAQAQITIRCTELPSYGMITP